MAKKDLKHKAVSGIVWSALQRYSVMIIQFISGIILARMLTPYDCGCIGMLMIFMILAETFIDSGFGSALIQKKNPTQEDYSTIFFWNLGMAVLLYAILYSSAPAIARFYNIPLLCSVLRTQGVVLFIYAFNIVQRNLLQKKLRFKVISVVTIVTSVTSLTITILMAYYGYGVWSLVAQNILTATIPAIVFWFYIKWRPQIIFSTKSFRELFSFGFYMFLTDIFNRFGHQIQGLLIGKFYNASTMGLYSKAKATERLASTSISQVLAQVTFPLYAEVQDDKNALGHMIRRMTMTLSYITFPLLFILLLCAKPIFVLLYSDKWVGSVPYFQVLCLTGMAYSLQSVNYQSIYAIGRIKIMFEWTIVKRIVEILLVVLGLISFGMKGLLGGMLLSNWFSYFVNIGLVSKYIGYRWWNQLKDIIPILFVSAMVAILSFYIIYLFHFPLYIDGLLKFSLYIILYCGFSLIFKLESFNYFLTIVKPVYNKVQIKLFSK